MAFKRRDKRDHYRMKKLIIIALLATLGWQGYAKHQARQQTFAAVHEPEKADRPRSALRLQSDASFKCDGRTHCSQMTSCEEATFFLRNCPGVKMDGNNDGIPCERQWCK